MRSSRNSLPCLIVAVVTAWGFAGLRGRNPRRMAWAELRRRRRFAPGTFQSDLRERNCHRAVELQKWARGFSRINARHVTEQRAGEVLLQC